jgi:hypothetical protein
MHLAVHMTLDPLFIQPWSGADCCCGCCWQGESLEPTQTQGGPDSFVSGNLSRQQLADKEEKFKVSSSFSVSTCLGFFADSRARNPCLMMSEAVLHHAHQ